MSLRDIAKEIGCHDFRVDVMLKGQDADPRPVTWSLQKGHLRIDDREQILLGLRQKESMSSIARRLGYSPSTVTREVKANGGADKYGIWPAHQRAQAQTKRPKISKLQNPALNSNVTMWLKQLWSPEEISNRIS
jgi:IS30 family transposase